MIQHTIRQINEAVNELVCPHHLDDDAKNNWWIVTDAINELEELRERIQELEAKQFPEPNRG